MAHNVFGLGEEADLTAQKIKVALMFNTAPQIHSSTETAFLPNPCYRMAAVNQHKL
jgi:hypothetical protein